MGQYIKPISTSYLNLSGGTVTGNTVFTQGLSATTLNGNVITSGGTDLYSIFALSGSSSGGGSGYPIQPGLNTYTGGTYSSQTINVSAVTLDSLSVSGTTSLGSVSATTYYGDGSRLSGISTDNFYTTGATLYAQKIYFDRNDTLSAYTLDLTSLVFSGDVIDGGSF